MKRRKIPGRTSEPRIINMNGQFYGQNSLGQMTRLDSDGRPIPRIRMSKKEKLKLRKELHEINETDSHESAGMITEKAIPVSVVNPKPEEQLKAEQEAVAVHA